MFHNIIICIIADKFIDLYHPKWRHIISIYLTNEFILILIIMKTTLALPDKIAHLPFIQNSSCIEEIFCKRTFNTIYINSSLVIIFSVQSSLYLFLSKKIFPKVNLICYNLISKNYQGVHFLTQIFCLIFIKGAKAKVLKRRARKKSIF